MCNGNSEGAKWMMVKAKERSVSTVLDLAGWMWKWFVFLYLIAQLLQKVFNSSSTRLPEITFISSCPALQRVIPPSSPSSPPLPSGRRHLPGDQRRPRRNRAKPSGREGLCDAIAQRRLCGAAAIGASRGPAALGFGSVFGCFRLRLRLCSALFGWFRRGSRQMRGRCP